MQEKKGRIIFFPIKHFPRYSVSDELERLQAEINQANFNIRQNHYQNGKYDNYQIMLRKQQLANMLRSKWKLIDCKSYKGE